MERYLHYLTHECPGGGAFYTIKYIVVWTWDNSLQSDICASFTEPVSITMLPGSTIGLILLFISTSSTSAIVSSYHM